jgi:hypothetical protein
MIRWVIVWPYLGPDQVLAGVLDGLLDRQRDLAGLAVADPDHGVLVADRDQAVNEKRRPPLTTLATRLISITRSCRSSPGADGLYAMDR